MLRHLEDVSYGKLNDGVDTGDIPRDVFKALRLAQCTIQYLAHSNEELNYRGAILSNRLKQNEVELQKKNEVFKKRKVRKRQRQKELDRCDELLSSYDSALMRFSPKLAARMRRGEDVLGSDDLGFDMSSSSENKGGNAAQSSRRVPDASEATKAVLERAKQMQEEQGQALQRHVDALVKAQQDRLDGLLAGINAFRQTAPPPDIIVPRKLVVGDKKVQENTEKVESDDMVALRKIFDEIDSDGDGTLNKREVIIAIRKSVHIAKSLGLPEKISEGSSRDVFEAAFQEADENDDRSLTWEEFSTHFKLRIQKAVDAMNQNTDAVEPVPDPIVEETETKELIENADESNLENETVEKVEEIPEGNDSVQILQDEKTKVDSQKEEIVDVVTEADEDNGEDIKIIDEESSATFKKTTSVMVYSETEEIVENSRYTDNEGLVENDNSENEIDTQSVLREDPKVSSMVTNDSQVSYFQESFDVESSVESKKQNEAKLDETKENEEKLELTDALETKHGYSEGQIVEARFGEGNIWYSGKVSRTNKDGTLCILYDDGDVEESVRVELVRTKGGKDEDDEQYSELDEDEKEEEYEENIDEREKKDSRSGEDENTDDEGDNKPKETDDGKKVLELPLDENESVSESHAGEHTKDEFDDESDSEEDNSLLRRTGNSSMLEEDSSVELRRPGSSMQEDSSVDFRRPDSSVAEVSSADYSATTNSVTARLETKDAISAMLAPLDLAKVDKSKDTQELVDEVDISGYVDMYPEAAAAARRTTPRDTTLANNSEEEAITTPRNTLDQSQESMAMSQSTFDHSQESATTPRNNFDRSEQGSITGSIAEEPLGVSLVGDDRILLAGGDSLSVSASESQSGALTLGLSSDGISEAGGDTPRSSSSPRGSGLVKQSSGTRRPPLATSQSRSAGTFSYRSDFEDDDSVLLGTMTRSKMESKASVTQESMSVDSIQVSQSPQLQASNVSKFSSAYEGEDTDSVLMGTMRQSEGANIVASSEMASQKTSQGSGKSGSRYDDSVLIGTMPPPSDSVEKPKQSLFAQALEARAREEEAAGEPYIGLPRNLGAEEVIVMTVSRLRFLEGFALEPSPGPRTQLVVSLSAFGHGPYQSPPQPSSVAKEGTTMRLDFCMSFPVIPGSKTYDQIATSLRGDDPDETIGTQAVFTLSREEGGSSSNSDRNSSIVLGSNSVDLAEEVFDAGKDLIHHTLELWDEDGKVIGELLITVRAEKAMLNVSI